MRKKNSSFGFKPESWWRNAHGQITMRNPIINASSSFKQNKRKETK